MVFPPDFDSARVGTQIQPQTIPAFKGISTVGSAGHGRVSAALRTIATPLCSKSCENPSKKLKADSAGLFLIALLKSALSRILRMSHMKTANMDLINIIYIYIYVCEYKNMMKTFANCCASVQRKSLYFLLVNPR